MVTASIHTGLGQSRERITERHDLGHPKPPRGYPRASVRPAYKPSRAFGVRRAAVFEAAAEPDCLEINSQPDRLDLKGSDCPPRDEVGCHFAINTDAHQVRQLDLIRYGVATARRGWVTKDHVLNALPLVELLKRLKT